jgi:molybdopterin-guanine dinucleotide biosynthesis protein A
VSCSAIILAGGQSQRLGTDKALLELDGKWLLERIVNTLASLSNDLLVIANDEEKFAQLPVRLIPDARPGTGPLGGIYSGLQAMRHERGLFVACDMPLLNPALLQYMIQLSADFDVVIPRIAGNTEPLHAVYSKACVRPIAKVLDGGELRVIAFFPQVRVRYVEHNEIDVLDPEHLSFFNINTPDDLKRAQQSVCREATPGAKALLEDCL